MPFTNCDKCEMPRSCQGVRYCAKADHPHRPRNPNSLMSQVERIVHAHGQCTLDTVAAELPGYSRDQVRAALSECSKYGRLTVAERGKRRGRGLGSWPSVYTVPQPQEPRTIELPALFHLWRAMA